MGHLRRTADRGAIYCWAPGVRDKDQAGVDQQEVSGRELAARSGITVLGRHVYVDHRLSAWSSNGAPPRWAAMLSAAKAGEFGHLFLHRPDRLLRRPRELQELLRVAEENGLLLHGDADGPDLADPVQRQRFEARAARAHRALRNRSEQAEAANEQAVAAGRPHGGGPRRYGYRSGMDALVEPEAAIVREIFARFLAGESLRAIAVGLNDRAVPTAGGGRWTVGGVARIVDAPRYAGLLTVRGEIARQDDGRPRPGQWPPCIEVADWERARALRADQAEARSATRRPGLDYPLTGLVWCTLCERHMVGSAIAGYRMYACTSPSRLQAGRCVRRIGAQSLETHMETAAVTVLRRLDSHRPVPDRVTARGSAAEPHLRQLDELSAQLLAGRITGPQYTEQRAAALKRIRAAQQSIVVRPAGALDGVVTGPDAEPAWQRMSPDRRTAVVRYLFSAILIDASSTSRGVFDPGRVRAVPNPG